MGKQLVSVQPVNDYTTVHPALDFWDSMAIVSVGCKWQENYNVLDKQGNIKSTEIAFTTNPYCIMSDGEKFRYTKQELANRSLFYSGKIELPEKSRWDYSDIDDYGKNEQSLTFPEIYNIVSKEFKYYVDYVDTRYYKLLACFTIYTYFYPLFFNAPILQFWGEMRTGKTKNLSLLEAMCFNPVNSANISSASVFRLTEARRATIMFDESEDLMTSDRSRDIRNMLLAGTGRSGETYRQEKGTDDSFKTMTFKVFSPKVIANIAGIDMPALLSRIIRISCIATKNRDKDNRCVELEDKKWQTIRNQLYRLLLTRFEEVAYTRDIISNEVITGRTHYIWQGILTIAKLADPEIANELIELAIENKEELEAEIEDYNADPQKLVAELQKLPLDLEQYYTSNELITRFGIEFGITSARDLAFRLGKLGLKSKLFSRNGIYHRYYFITNEKLQKVLKS
jgi:hypothetical protein